MSEKGVRKTMAQLARDGFDSVAQEAGVQLRQVAEAVFGYGVKPDYALELIQNNAIPGLQGGPGSTK